VALKPLQKSDYSHLDRLLFYAGLAVLLIALPAALRELRQGIPALVVPGGNERALVFTQWRQDEGDDASLPGLIREFEERNPGIRIELDTRPYREVRALLLSGTETDAEARAALPDIVSLDPRWLPALNAEDLFESVEPLFSDLILLFYRTDLLRQAGFDRPPKNRTEFTALARALADPARRRYGFALALNAEDAMGVYRDVLPWFRSAGPSLLSNGGPAFTAAPVVDTLRFLDALSREGLLAPEPFAKTGRDLREDFAAGRLAMMLAPARSIKTLRAAGLPFGVTTIPGPDAYIGKPVVGLTTRCAGVLRSSPYGDEARAFLAFLGEKAGGPWPAAGADSLELKVRDIYAAADTTGDYLGLPAETALEAILGEELSLMFASSRTPEETAAAVQKRWMGAEPLLLLPTPQNGG
jgi:multiple sugar transport system substrate-binding protein